MMRTSLPLIVMTLCCANLMNVSVAQNQSAEFIESSSPLPDGSRVISRSFPGGDIQTVTSVAPRPVAGAEKLRESAFRQSSQSNTVTGTFNQKYPYPAAPNVPRSVLLHPPVRATATQGNPIPHQIPTLGITNAATNNSTGSFSSGNCNAQTFRRVPAARSPVIQIQPPNVQTPTSLAGDPVQGTRFNSTAMQNRGYLPTTSAQTVSQQNGLWTPFLTGSGAYRPAVRLVNVPPGTYTGQGIIGQPKAYVDGQPIRNLFRYILP